MFTSRKTAACQLHTGPGRDPCTCLIFFLSLAAHHFIPSEKPGVSKPGGTSLCYPVASCWLIGIGDSNRGFGRMLEESQRQQLVYSTWTVGNRDPSIPGFLEQYQTDWTRCPAETSSLPTHSSYLLFVPVLASTLADSASTGGRKNDEWKLRNRLPISSYAIHTTPLRDADDGALPETHQGLSSSYHLPHRTLGSSLCLGTAKVQAIGWIL